MIELYDKNNPEHNDRGTYEVVEWEEDIDGRHPNSVVCGDIMSDAQRR